MTLRVSGAGLTSFAPARLRFLENVDAEIRFDWRDCCGRRNAFSRSSFCPVVARKGLVRLCGEGVCEAWKTGNACKRGGCPPEARTAGCATLRGGRDLLLGRVDEFLTDDVFGIPRLNQA